MLELCWLFQKCQPRPIHTKEPCTRYVYAECPAKLDDNHANRHHAIDRYFDLDR